MDGEIGFEPMLPGSEPGVLPLDDSPAFILAGELGLEPRSSASKAEVLPLDDSPMF